MKKMYKAMLLVLCAVLLVAASVMGTLAYLKSETKTITNVMTVGKVEITLSESVVDIYGKKTSGEIVATATQAPVKTNQYKLIPNGEYVKDPKVTVQPGSEASYLFVKVVNEIKGIEDTSNTIESQILAKGWTLLAGDIYYKQVDATQDVEVEYPVFTEFKVSATATATELAAYEGNTITITAYAVQKEGFASAEAAWNATFGN